MKQTRRAGRVQARLRIAHRKTHTLSKMPEATTDLEKTDRNTGETERRAVQRLEASGDPGMDEGRRENRKRVSGTDEHAA